MALFCNVSLQYFTLVDPAGRDDNGNSIRESILPVGMSDRNGHGVPAQIKRRCQSKADVCLP